MALVSKILFTLFIFGTVFGQQPQQQACYDGAQTRKGNFWYVCRQGREVPISCVSSEGIRFDIGTTYRSEHFLLQCHQPSDGAIQITPIACVNQGQVINPGAVFSNDQTFYYRCNRGDNSLHLQLAGCVGSDGGMVGHNGIVKRGSFVYRCVLTGTGARIEPEGCFYENRQYRINEDIVTPAVWYRCEADQSGMSIKLQGCIRNGVRYRVNDKFQDGNFYFRCTHESNKIYPMAVGCVNRNPDGSTSEYAPGGKWVVTVSDNSRYVMECRQEGQMLKKMPVQCYFSLPQGSGYLEGGCMRRVGDQTVQCLPVSPDSPNIRMRITEKPSRDDEQRFYASGLRYC